MKPESQRSYRELGLMKKIFDVSTIYKGKTFKEIVHADTLMKPLRLSQRNITERGSSP
jgi:hypothetical protein